MSKDQMIENICKVNRSAAPEFLGGFEERELASYLRRLTHLLGQRGKESIWIREGDTHAVVTTPH